MTRNSTAGDTASPAVTTTTTASDESRPTRRNWRRTTGIVISVLVGAFLAFDVAGKLARPQAVIDGMRELGFPAYTAQNKTNLDVFAITMALMVGTAGLPHVITRFYTTPTVQGARTSAIWAIVFISLLYTTVPALAIFANIFVIQ